MGFYYKSLFRNSKTTILLSNHNTLIDLNDLKQGYVCKEELLDKFSHLVVINDIDDVSYVEDYELCTLDGNFKATLLRSLRVL